MMAGAVPFLFFFSRMTAPHSFESHFPLVLFLAVAGNLLGFYGYVRAIELTDVSLAMPLISLTPFFMILTSWLMLAELPDLQGLIGIVAVVIGTYFLSRKPGMSGLRPLYALLEDRGCRYALMTALVWSVQANIDKFAVRATDPVVYSFWFHVLFALLLLPFVLYRRPRLRETTAKTAVWKWIIFGILAVGFLEALLSGAQMMAITDVQVSYVIAVKRAGMLFSVLGGGLIFAEEDLKRRFLSATIVFVGLLSIVLR